VGTTPPSAESWAKVAFAIADTTNDQQWFRGCHQIYFAPAGLETAVYFFAAGTLPLPPDLLE
jgi:hypothetical protein